MKIYDVRDVAFFVIAFLDFNCSSIMWLTGPTYLGRTCVLLSYLVSSQAIPVHGYLGQAQKDSSLLVLETCNTITFSVPLRLIC